MTYVEGAVQKKSEDKARQTARRTRTAKKPARPVAKKAARRTTAQQNAAVPTIVEPGCSWDHGLPLALAKQIGNTIYVSGQIAVNPQGNLVGTGNMKAQTRQVFRNIKAVLAKAGAKMERIIKINTYITDGSKFMDMLEARGDVFGNNPPASTAVVVAGLAFPGLLIEVEAIAVKP